MQFNQTIRRYFLDKAVNSYLLSLLIHLILLSLSVFSMFIASSLSRIAGEAANAPRRRQDGFT